MQYMFLLPSNTGFTFPNCFGFSLIIWWNTSLGTKPTNEWRRHNAVDQPGRPLPVSVRMSDLTGLFNSVIYHNFNFIRPSVSRSAAVNRILNKNQSVLIKNLQPEIEKLHRSAVSIFHHHKRSETVKNHAPIQFLRQFLRRDINVVVMNVAVGYFHRKVVGAKRDFQALAADVRPGRTLPADWYHGRRHLNWTAPTLGQAAT